MPYIKIYRVAPSGHELAGRMGTGTIGAKDALEIWHHTRYQTTEVLEASGDAEMAVLATAGGVFVAFDVDADLDEKVTPFLQVQDEKEARDGSAG